MNQGQPQTLVIAVLLLYFRAVWTLLGLKLQYVVFPGSSLDFDGRVSNPLLQLGLPVLMVAAGYLVANERKIGWRLAVVASALPLFARVMVMFGVSFGVAINSTSPLDYDLLGLLLEVALFALVVHPQSRSYQRIWFR